MTEHIQRHAGIYLIIAFYLVIGAIFLTTYPHLNYDEGILAVFANEFRENGIPIIDRVTSGKGAFTGMNFFPLSGSLYYSSLALFGFAGIDLYFMRLHSLFFSVIILIFTYRIGLKLFQDRRTAAWAVFLAAFSTHFQIAAQTIRQEAMLVAFLMASFDFFLTGIRKKNTKALFTAGCFAGLSVCVHPNGVYFPVLFFILYLWGADSGPGKLKTLFKAPFAGVLLGYFTFALLDYWPYRDEYFQLMTSDLFGKALVNKHGFSPWGYFSDVWSDLWQTHYHRHVVNAVFCGLALGGAFFFRRAGHQILLVMIALIVGLSMVLHRNLIYLVYYVPFFSLLGASVAHEAAAYVLRKGSAVKVAVKVCAVGFTIFYLNFPLGNLWAFRGYDYRRELDPIVKALPDNEPVLADSVYVFVLPRERVYSYYLLTGYKVERLLKEIDVQYVVQNQDAAPWFGKQDFFSSEAPANIEYLRSSCAVVANAFTYGPGILTTDYFADPILLHRCDGP